MYAAIVRRKVIAVFDRINDGDYLYMVDGLADRFTYVFHGDHALGGRRTTKASMVKWWERITVLLPGVKFTIAEVLVTGTPWNTRVAVRSSVRGPLPLGQIYENTVFQFITLRWGKVTSVETMEDLLLLDRALRLVAREGNDLAVASPINDPV